MAWTDLTFAYGSLLTATKMTQLDNNFDALAGGDSGAPQILTAALLSVDTVRVQSIGQTADIVSYWYPSPGHYLFNTVAIEQYDGFPVTEYEIGFEIKDQNDNWDTYNVRTGGGYNADCWFSVTTNGSFFRINTIPPSRALTEYFNIYYRKVFD